MRDSFQAAINIYNYDGISELVKKGVQKYLSNNWIQAKIADIEFKRRKIPNITKSSPDPQHVVLIVIDCLRADIINADVTPTLAKLEGTSAIATSPWTYPSVTSINTGLYPHEHGAIRQNDYPDNNDEQKTNLPPKLDEDILSLSDHFTSDGYHTYGGFAFQMPFLALSGRFETHKLYSDANAQRVITDYLEWLQKLRNERTFAYLHLSDPHDPVDPPTEYWEKYDVNRDIPNITRWDYADEWSGERTRNYRKHRQRLYRAAVDYVDDQVSLLMERAESITSSDPVFLITGDHGEAFWEHSALDAEHFYDSRPAYSVGHGGTPYESIARVPLYGKNVRVREGDTSTVDILPTLLDEAEIRPREEISGTSHINELPEERILLVEATRNGYEKKAAYKNGYKLLVSKGDDEVLGFSLPDEEVTDIPADIEQELRGVFPDWPSGGEERQVSGSVRERLNDLGYT